MSEKEKERAMLDEVVEKLKSIRKTYDKKTEIVQQMREKADFCSKTIVDVIGVEIETVVSLLDLADKLCEALKEELNRE